MTDTVATIILQQLGGRAFLRMTGAKNLLDGGDHLQMDVPCGRTQFGKRVNKIRVTLAADDTYTVTAFFYSRARFTCDEISKSGGVYVENLREVFTRMTGLETQLPRIAQFSNH